MESLRLCNVRSLKTVNGQKCVALRVASGFTCSADAQQTRDSMCSDFQPMFEVVGSRVVGLEGGLRL